jgi:hypothetical protein
LRAVENDFDGTRMTMPLSRDAMGQSGDGGSFVRVHRVQTRVLAGGSTAYGPEIL